MSRIAVDKGHGIGEDRGAIGVVSEESIINEVGSSVVLKLKALGHEVLEVRPSNASSVTDSLSQRCVSANNWGADLFISIHANAGGGRGTEVFTYGGKELDTARKVLNNIVALGFTNRGVKGESLYVTNHTNMDAMLLEICFVDTQSDIDLYNSVGVARIANAIVEGLTGQTSNVVSNPTPQTDNIEQSSGDSTFDKAKSYNNARCLEIQNLLIKCGYALPKYGADNSYGYETHNQIGNFQRDFGLEVDYLCGANTINKLKQVVNSKTIATTPVASPQGRYWVGRVQQVANVYGANIAVDNYWGANTENGVKNIPLSGVQYTNREATKFIQERLGIEIDGIFMGGTAEAVGQWQRKHSLKDDQVVGFQTLRSLTLED